MVIFYNLETWNVADNIEVNKYDSLQYYQRHFKVQYRRNLESCIYTSKKAGSSSTVYVAKT